ncbi:MAG: hypothetical protein CMJ89_05410 [Planctomycetes bacterium]|nr:hypothetical protein [Planctomycetota bacterium]
MRVACLLAVLAALFACGSGRSDELPDVVVVVVDTLRADHLGLYGYDRETAPFLAEWAERSVSFDRAFSTSSWTAPAAASLFTGVYPIQHGVTMGMNAYQGLKRMRGDLELNRIPEELETLPEFMRSLGYRTFGIADNPNICAAEGFERGFDRFVQFDYEGAPAVEKSLLEWGAEIRSARPFFLYLHYMDPHLPYHEREPWHEPSTSTDVHEQNRAAYDSEIRYFDQHLRRAFETLGIGEDDIVIITADHGEEFGEHGDGNHLFKLYDELVRIPLLIHHPGVDPEVRRVGANVSLVDILPTLRRMLGAPPSTQDIGISLTRNYLEGREDERTVFSMRRSEIGHKAAVIGGGYKYVLTERNADLFPDARREHELYDLNLDPGEKRNLAGRKPDLVQELQGRWTQLQAEAPRWTPESEWITLTPEEIRRLSSLGYGGEK